MNARPVLWAGAADAAAAVRQQCPQAAADALAAPGRSAGTPSCSGTTGRWNPLASPSISTAPSSGTPSPPGPEWTYALNRHTIFVHLGKAWQYTGQARYLDAFVSLLGTGWTACPVPPPARTPPGGRWKPACAPAYNRVEDAPALRLDAPAAAGVTALVWVLSLGGPCQAELVPVSTGAGQPLPPGTAGAVRIRGTGRNPPSCSAGRRGATTPACSAPGTAPATGMSLFSPRSAPGLCLD